VLFLFFLYWQFPCGLFGNRRGRRWTGWRGGKSYGLDRGGRGRGEDVGDCFYNGTGWLGRGAEEEGAVATTKEEIEGYVGGCERVYGREKKHF
jgi:hypothetical protein